VNLRLGVVRRVVGINLLREGLDLPEVKSGGDFGRRQRRFLRSAQALIQTVAVLPRHIEGHVIMYADPCDSMRKTLDETTRRRKLEQYNIVTDHHFSPRH